ncbi:hypothetical protein ACJX0J_006280 [Zea mays]
MILISIINLLRTKFNGTSGSHHHLSALYLLSFLHLYCYEYLDQIIVKQENHAAWKTSYKCSLLDSYYIAYSAIMIGSHTVTQEKNVWLVLRAYGLIVPKFPPWLLSFRMSKVMFNDICEAVTAALRMLAYGGPADSLDEMWDPGDMKAILAIF